MDITSLPDSILVEIFKYLSLEELCLSLRLTCAKWKELSYDFSLWNTLNLQSKAAYLTDKDLIEVLSQIGKHVVQLNIANCNKISCIVFISSKVNCPILKSINIINTHIRNVGIKALLCDVEKFPILETVHCRMPGDVPKGIDQYYYYCCEAYQNKRVLRTLCDPYSEIFGPTPEDINQGILKIAALYTSLTTVIVSHKELQGVTLEELCKRNPYICTLNVQQCLWVADSLPLIAVYLQSLTELNISYTPTKDSQLIEVARHHLSLRKLNITACRKITDVAIAEVTALCSKLESLILNDSMLTSGSVTDNGLCDIARNCSVLKELRVVFCPSISDKGVVAVANQCRELQVVDVTGCLQLTNASFEALAHNCRLLRQLKASECVKLTADGVNAIVKKCLNLTHLELETCHYLTKLNFTDTHINLVESTEQESGIINYFIRDSLLTSPCRLQVLDLSFCSNIATVSVKQIACHCPMLRSLSLRGCYAVTDQAIEFLGKNCRLLNVLDISATTMNHSKLTDLSLLTLVHSPNLTMLSVTKNHSITLNGLTQLLGECHTLKRLNVTVGKEIGILDLLDSVRMQRGSVDVQGITLKNMHSEWKGEVIVILPTVKYAL